jgi:hypothetical protein
MLDGKIMIPNVIVFNDYITSVCSFWRSQYPLSLLAKEGFINLIIGEYGKEDWTILSSCNVAFFQRPMAKEVKDQVLMCLDLKLKIIIDIDDHNAISPSHPIYKIWSERYDELSFRKIMKCADIVTVTTKPLKDYYLKYNDNVVIVPNALNLDWLKFNLFSNNKIIVLRGGDHHWSDIWFYRKEIEEVMKNHPDWQLHVIGGDIDFLKCVKGYLSVGDFDIHRYFAYILKTNPSIFIVPLENNELNHGKSNISWQEATLSGGAALTPSYFNLYRHSQTYKDKKTFKEGFERLIEDQKLRFDYWTNSVEKIKKDYSLSNINKQRLEIIKNLML